MSFVGDLVLIGRLLRQLVLPLHSLQKKDKIPARCISDTLDLLQPNPSKYLRGELGHLSVFSCFNHLSKDYSLIIKEARTVDYFWKWNLVNTEEEKSLNIVDSIVWLYLKCESYGPRCKIGNINHISIVTTSKLGPIKDEKWPKIKITVSVRTIYERQPRKRALWCCRI